MAPTREELDLAERKRRAFRLAEDIIRYSRQLSELAQELKEEVASGNSGGASTAP